MIKTIDKDGLILCDIQAKIFESSYDKEMSSSEIFIRRFMNSEMAQSFDSKAILEDSYTPLYIHEEIDHEYGESNYGTKKYTKNELNWIGYLYRYFSYTYFLSSKQVYKIIKPKELKELYIPYHSLDCDQAIERILEAKNLSFDEEAMIKRGVKIMREIRLKVK